MQLIQELLALLGSLSSTTAVATSIGAPGISATVGAVVSPAVAEVVQAVLPPVEAAHTAVKNALIGLIQAL